MRLVACAAYKHVVHPLPLPDRVRVDAASLLFELLHDDDDDVRREAVASGMLFVDFAQPVQEECMQELLIQRIVPSLPTGMLLRTRLFGPGT